MSATRKNRINKKIKITVISTNKPSAEAILNTATYLKTLCKKA
ncbi:hypothetical protein [Gottfriedia acidiceleris]|nr:hypothetical protein [Gottfriedia acidiceleris]